MGAEGRSRELPILGGPVSWPNGLLGEWAVGPRVDGVRTVELSRLGANLSAGGLHELKGRSAAILVFGLAPR